MESGQTASSYLQRKGSDEMTYSKTEIHEFSNGVNIVHFPDLTEEERTKRHFQLVKAAERFLKHVETVKGEKSNG